jgi:hypothetical protein
MFKMIIQIYMHDLECDSASHHTAFVPIAVHGTKRKHIQKSVTLVHTYIANDHFICFFRP